MDDNITNNSAPLPPPYENALRFLCRPVSKASYPGDLTPLNKILARLGHPERRFRSVIITGSIGKGTVAHLVAGTLHAAGFRTGLFTGPHLYHFRERMALDGELISVATLTEQIAHLQPLVTPDLGRLSTFELATALAFDWFAKERVEFAVLEVGVGGRYDAVNLAPAESAIITPVELEHTVLLGDSLTKIAHHKADVIPRSGFAVTAPQPQDVQKIIAATCEERGSLLIDVGQRATWSRTNREHFRVTYDGINVEGSTQLLGRHNAMNIALALAWASEAAKRDVQVGAAHVVQAANGLRIPGRVELVQKQERVILIDGAHTPGAAGALADTIDSLELDGERTYLVATSKDKDARGFLEALRIPRSARLILTTYVGHRTMPLDTLNDLAAQVGLQAQPVPDYGAALDLALARHKNRGLIVATGSLFVAAQIREALGLLDDEELTEARLTRQIFTGTDYLAMIDKERSDETTSLAPQHST